MARKNIDAIIFSKDRAMQLDALLRSMALFAPRLLASVLCTGSTGDYQLAYRRLIREWRECCRLGLTWIEQNYFKKQLATEVFLSGDLTMLLCDDDLFYRRLPDFELLPDEAYAARLGRNCTYCYMRDCPQAEGELDFAYPCSLDGQVYHTHELLPRLDAAEYSNPNELEAALCARYHPKLRYAEHSCLVGIPHNSVGPNKGNRNMGGSAEELNRMFLDGWRIDLDAMHKNRDFDNVIGVHQAIPYRLYKP